MIKKFALFPFWLFLQLTVGRWEARDHARTVAYWQAKQRQMAWEDAQRRADSPRRGKNEANLRAHEQNNDNTQQ